MKRLLFLLSATMVAGQLTGCASINPSSSHDSVAPSSQRYERVTKNAVQNGDPLLAQIQRDMNTLSFGELIQKYPYVVNNPDLFAKLKERDRMKRYLALVEAKQAEYAGRMNVPLPQLAQLIVANPAIHQRLMAYANQLPKHELENLYRASPEVSNKLRIPLLNAYVATVMVRFYELQHPAYNEILLWAGMGVPPIDLFK